MVTGKLKFLLAATSLLILSACGDAGNSGGKSEGEPEPAANASAPQADLDELPSPDELLPMPFRVIWQPWYGDWDGMVERRVIRAVVPFDGYQYYYDAGKPRGATWELLQRLEKHVNETLSTGNVKVFVVAIPVNRDQLIPALEDGHADLIAADLTMTNERTSQLEFSRPLLTDVNEVIVTGKAVDPIKSIDDLAGREIVVRKSSSYHEHLLALQQDFTDRGLEPPTLGLADEILEAEDLLDMLNTGMIDITVLDDYKAKFWAAVFPHIVVRDDLVINESGAIGWAMRKNVPQFAMAIDGFMRRFGKGTMVGNDTYNRYLADASKVRCVQRRQPSDRLLNLASLFEKYGEQFDFSWLMLAAQGFQESGLRQDRKNPSGAVGVMQIKPSTAADRNIGIDDVTDIENNIHAAAKYMRFLADRYFNDPEIDELNQWLLTLGAYNAGPAKINRFRREAESNGYDPKKWFDNVEIIAARNIGRETVTYVSNIFKYYVGYQLTVERLSHRGERHGEALNSCWADENA
jgi:membrane-bound lytic murein transglycosylase MltF